MTARPFLVGLTGSIGMGKSTTAGMFQDEGIPVWDADAAVHRLYSPGGGAIEKIEALCPEAVDSSGVDRAKLAAWIGQDGDRLRRVEAVIHPLVAQDRAQFIAECDAPILLFDIPLLFETGTDRDMDAVVVVSADAETQRDRVLKRPGMTEDRFTAILARQMPDAEKRCRADYVILTSTLDAARRAVQSVLRDIRESDHARNRAGYRNDRV